MQLDLRKEHELVENWNKGKEPDLDIYTLLYDMEALLRIIMKKAFNQRIPQDYNEQFINKKGIKILFVHLLSQIKNFTLDLPHLRVIRYILTCISLLLKPYRKK